MKVGLMKKKRSGFTLVETIVAVGVFGIFFAAIALILQQVLQNVGYARARSVALALGQENMELVRNLPYASVGTVGGIPAGPIAQIEATTVNNQQFTTKTDIVYIDDPFDGVAPADSIPADYKRVRIQVTWNGLFPSRLPVTLVTNVVPNGIESNPGGGTLYIQVLDSQGLGVSGASVSIVNTAVTPQININTLTSATGTITIPGAPACVTCYKITATKSGFSTDRTYGSEEVTNPLHPHVTVIAARVSQLSLAIDRVGSLNVNSVGLQSDGYPTIVNVIFTLRGNKIIGHDASDNPVYKYSFQTTTGGGNVGIPNLEWDNYTIDLSNSNYTLAGSDPLLPLTLLPATSMNARIIVDPKYANSLMVIIKDQAGNRLASAAANLKNMPQTVNITKITPATGSPDFGQVFYNNLPTGTYMLIASLSGYTSASSSMQINTNKQATLVLN